MTRVSLWESNNRKSSTRRSRLSVRSCQGRRVYIHQQSSRVIPHYVNVQQSETQDWPESTTDRIIWLKQLHNSAMLAPGRRRVSTTVYLPAQFCRFIRSQRLSANTDFKEGLALQMSKAKKSRDFFPLFFSLCVFFVSFCFLSTQCSILKPQKK